MFIPILMALPKLFVPLVSMLGVTAVSAGTLVVCSSQSSSVGKPSEEKISSKKAEDIGDLLEELVLKHR